MQQLMLMLHMVIAFLLIVLILLQHGKGADMGASFGSGASQTLFGSQGSLPFLVKVTGILAALFFASSLFLGYLTAQQAKVDASANLPSLLRSNTSETKLPVPTTPGGLLPTTQPSPVIPGDTGAPTGGSTS